MGTVVISCQSSMVWRQRSPRKDPAVPSGAGRRGSQGRRDEGGYLPCAASYSSTTARGIRPRDRTSGCPWLLAHSRMSFSRSRSDAPVSARTGRCARPSVGKPSIADPHGHPCPAGVADQILQLILDLLAVLGAHVHLVVVTVESELDGLDPLGLVLVQVITTCTSCATDSFPFPRPRGRVAEHGADSAGHRNRERSRFTTVRQTSDMEERTALPSSGPRFGVPGQRAF